MRRSTLSGKGSGSRGQLWGVWLNLKQPLYQFPVDRDLSRHSYACLVCLSLSFFEPNLPEMISEGAQHQTPLLSVRLSHHQRPHLLSAGGVPGVPRQTILQGSDAGSGRAAAHIDSGARRAGRPQELGCSLRSGGPAPARPAASAASEPVLFPAARTVYHVRPDAAFTQPQLLCIRPT